MAALKKIRLLAYANFKAQWHSKETPPTLTQYWNLECDTATDTDKLADRKARFLDVVKRFHEAQKTSK